MAKYFKQSSAEIISDLLSDAKVKRVREYVGGEDFKSDRERVRQEAARRLKNVRDRYRKKGRTPETAAKERERRALNRAPAPGFAARAHDLPGLSGSSGGWLFSGAAGR